MIIDLNVLSERSINSAIRKMERRKKWLDQKANEFLTRLQAIGIDVAEMYYSRAAYAGEKDATVDHTVKVEKVHGGYVAEVHATGASVLFIEFSTGIRYENQYQLEHGFSAGSYNPSSPRALQPWGWFYRGTPGSHPPYGTEDAYKRKGLVHTYGNPANMVMYNTVHQLETLFAGIAKEVFSGD